MPTRPEVRAGHDISVSVRIDAGVPIQNLRSIQHKVDVEQTGAASAVVRLENQWEIPNRDFVLRYDVAGAQMEDAVLTHRDGNGAGYFTLILQPPERFPESDVTPKEIVFVLDTSGSMSGFPIEKGKELVGKMLTHLYPKDTFNLITFSGETAILFPEPVYANAETLSQAQKFLSSRRGGGGTEMMKAIKAALDPSDASDHIRIVCFVTDGYVGNDMEIVGEIKKHPNARVFSFGIGSSVNRFLLDKMAQAGRGEAEYVTLQQDGSKAANRLFERMLSPLLTDVSVDWGGLAVSETYPVRIPDVFAAKPVVIYGQYTKPGRGTIMLRGRRAGAPFERQIEVNLPATEKRHDVLGTLWAREKIDDLMAEDWSGMQSGEPKGDLKEQITQLGLQHRLMTQFTSFVAVEERSVTEGGEVRTVQVPVEMPQGVSYEGVFGGETKDRLAYAPQMMTMSKVAVNGPVGAVNQTVTVSSAAQTIEVSSTPAPIDMKSSSTNYTVVPGPPPPSGSSGKAKPPSKRELLESKADKDVLNAWECHWLGANNPSAPDSCKSGRPEKIHLRIEVTQVTEELKAKLRKLGFVADAKQDGKALVGMMPVVKLKEVAAIAEVIKIGRAENRKIG